MIITANSNNIKIATAHSRNSKDWKNHQISWNSLISRLQKNQVTSETVAEYRNMNKLQRDQIKDVGGFVGGNLMHGRRKQENVINRTIITLDADYAGLDFLEHIKTILPNTEYVVYSTHSHTPENPRFRVIIPLNREVNPEEYQAISRKIAYNIGLNRFDDTTFQPHRLMYWPSSCIDGEVIFEHAKGECINADSVLSTYSDWRDTSLWPVSEKVKKLRHSEIKKQGNPLEKQGVIGAFCRAYNIHEAIETFLSDIYTPCSIENRYTFIGGSTVAGAIVYDDVFLYSNHATDPASMKLCNAWDLVRIHKFGNLDEESEEGAFGNKLPSFSAMQELALKDKNVTNTISQEQIEKAKEEFRESGEPELNIDDTSWMSQLERNKNGFTNSIANCVIILKNDPNLKSLSYDEFRNCIVVRSKLPWRDISDKQWRDADDAQLECYVNRVYGTFSKNYILTAFMKVIDDRSFHPVREYFTCLPVWDSIDRAETLFIDYLGAEDNELNRILTRKTLCAAVARVFNPGVKFDTMLVLKGEQGIGKSKLLKKIGMNWFSDSLKLSDTRDKTAVELIQGYWIIEIGELAGLSRVDERILKSFLSRQDDVYRASYGRRTNSHPRQCIFIGTTNEDEFLTDVTGNRRYWIIPVRQQKPKYDIDTDLTSEEVNQIWAEVLDIYRKGEPIFLSKATSKKLNVVHEDHFVQDPQAGIIREFMNKKIPFGWDMWDLQKRRSFWQGYIEDVELTDRKKICVHEIYCELFNGDLKNLTIQESRRLTNIISKMEGWEKANSTIRCGPYGVQKGFKRYFVN